MFVVDYSRELREAFNAGRAAGAAPFIAAKWGKDADKYLGKIPMTYDEWIESVRHRPQIARG